MANNVPAVDLIYDAECPNGDAARKQLSIAFEHIGLPPKWREWDLGAPDLPDHFKGYGSPTILIDGRDVAALDASAQANCCRIYIDDGKLSGVPSAETVIKALKKAAWTNIQTGGQYPKRGLGWGSLASIVPAIGTSFLPALTCPACWPAYAGLLSAIGLGFVDYTPYILPLTILFVFIALAVFWYDGKRHDQYRPFWLAVVASALLMLGKSGWKSTLWTYLGIGGLICASVWSGWYRKNTSNTACSSCKPQNDEK